jgi:hypothetical protein
MEILSPYGIVLGFQIIHQDILPSNQVTSGAAQ